MNGTQVLITAVYGVLLLATTVFVVFVIRSTAARGRRREFDIERAKGRENRFAWLIVGLLVVLAVATAAAIPYSDTSPGPDGEVVEIAGFQFGWTVEPPTVPVGVPIEFRARSADVQHGFGLYQDNKLLAQVQVPANRPESGAELGPEQRLVHTFDEPGTYDLLCLEFCGSKHHAMVAEIEVEE
jgi:cytochrome c oxidase subunit II